MARRRAAGGGQGRGGCRGRALEGAERGPGAEQPGNGGGARSPRWVCARGWLGSEPGAAGIRGAGAGRRKLGLAGPVGPAGPAGPRSNRGGGGGGGSSERLRCPRRPGLRPASSRQVPPASLFLPTRGPGPAAGEGRMGIRAGGPGRGWGRRGRCPDFASPSRGGERAGRRRASAGPRPGCPLGVGARRIPVGPVEPPHPALAANPRSAFSASVSVSRTRGLSAFATVEGRSERERLVP